MSAENVSLLADALSDILVKFDYAMCAYAEADDAVCGHLEFDDALDSLADACAHARRVLKDHSTHTKTNKTTAANDHHNAHGKVR